MIVSSYSNIITVPLVVQAAAYISGNLVGGKITIPNVGYSGEIRTIELTDASNTAVDYDIFFFGSNPSGSTFTEKAALTLVAADLAKVIGAVTLGSASRFAFATNNIHFVRDITIPYAAERISGQGTLYAAILMRGAATFAGVNDLTLRLGIQGG